ncbi:MAG: RNA-binding protein [Candidatus Babeliales bacterium]
MTNTMNIYVGNLSYSTTEEQLKGLFEEFGQVTSAKIITDKFTGSPRGFAFVEMASADEAQQAIDNLNGKNLEGRDIVVKKALPPRKNFR